MCDFSNDEGCLNLVDPGHQLSEKELKLQEKMAEVVCLQRELDLSKAEQGVLQGQIQAERRKADKQTAGLREAIKTQRAQLEKALQVRCRVFPGGENHLNGVDQNVFSRWQSDCDGIHTFRL